MANESTGQSEPADHRWDELKAIQEIFVKTWQAYMIWFVWFCTGVFGVLGLVSGFNSGSSKIDRGLAIAAGTGCILCALAAMVGTVALLRYTLRAIDRATQLARSDGSHDRFDPHTLFAADVLKCLPWTFLFVFVVHIGLWLYLFAFRLI